MSERLDQLVERLNASLTDRSMEHFDADVVRGVVRLQAQAQAQARATRAIAPVRVASIGLALAIGVTAGGVTAAASITAPRNAGGFPVAADLAPSTLLDGGQ